MRGKGNLWGGRTLAVTGDSSTAKIQTIVRPNVEAAADISRARDAESGVVALRNREVALDGALRV